MCGNQRQSGSLAVWQSGVTGRKFPTFSASAALQSISEIVRLAFRFVNLISSKFSFSLSVSIEKSFTIDLAVVISFLMLLQ